ncbi:MAG: L-threonylcarbamoyladenylate synthase [bacterium]|nr:L-threonylcarbamoyladenylate synthase [bacterium]
MQKLLLHQLDQAVAILRAGGVVVYPTETSYALGCDATNERAIKKIYKIKNRITGKPFLVIVPSVSVVKRYLRWNKMLTRLARNYWPGPLTVVGDYRRPLFSKNLASGAVSKDKTLAVRVSVSTIPNYLSRRLGHPIVATSANISTVGDIYDAEKIRLTFMGEINQPDAFIDVGDLPRHPPTTIVSVLNDQVQILRQGELQVDEIFNI